MLKSNRPQASPSPLDTVDLDTVAELNVLLADGDVATLTGTETLSAKTLTAPIVTVPFEASTVGVGAPNVLTAAESFKVLSNEGASALAYNTLPGAAAGIIFVFTVQDADGIRITAATGDTIRVGTEVTPTAGHIDSTEIGSTITLVAINATEWLATTMTGTWVVTTS